MEYMRGGLKRYAIALLVMAILLGSAYGAHTARAAYTHEPVVNLLRVDTEINNNYAVTEITEEIENPVYDPIWATLSIKIPYGMFISNFSMSIGENVYYAEVVPKDVGEEEFQEAVSNGSDAALLSLSDDGLFSYSLSLSSYQSIRICMRYEGYIEKSMGGYEYTVPFSGMYMPDADHMAVDVRIVSADRVIYVSVPDGRYDRASTSINEGIARVHYDEAPFHPSEDMHIEYQTSAPPVNGTLLTYGGEEGYFMHIFSPQIGYLGKAIPKDIVFVLDHSGSMTGTKIEQMKDAFSTIIWELPEQDRFNVVIFNDKVEVYSEDILPASEENRRECVDYMGSLEAIGLTNIDEAMLTAISMLSNESERIPIIVMLTDGLPTVGVTDTEAIRNDVLEANEAGVSIFSLGFGNDVDFDFLRAMSLENGGVAVKIDVSEDAGESITGFYDTISTPLLKDIHIAYSPNVGDIYPEYAKQMFSGTELMITGRYTGSYIVSNISATTWSGEMRFSGNFTVSPDENNSFIERLWAYSRIMYLLDEVTVDGENPSLVENITALALKYGFVTPYTSMLIRADASDDEDWDDGYDDGDDTDEKNIFDPYLPGGSMDGSGSAPPPDDGRSYGTDSEEPDSTGYNQAPIVLVAMVFALLSFGMFRNRRKR